MLCLENIMEKQILLNGHGVAYDALGAGKSTLVFAHGFGEDRRVFSDFIQPLTSRFKVFNIDIAGVGGSDVLPEYSMAYMAGVIHAVAQAEGLSKFVLVGHSMGGYVALEYAERYGESLSGLCLFHSHPFEDNGEKKEGRRKSMEFVERNGSRQYVRQLITHLFSEDFKSSNPEVVERQISRACEFPPETIIGCLGAMLERKDKTHILKEASFPVMSVLGKEDQTLPFEMGMRQTHLAPISKVKILEKAGHMGMLECPVECQNAIADFAILVKALE